MGKCDQTPLVQPPGQIPLVSSLVKTYPTESFCKVVLQKSIPTQIRQLILYDY